MPAPFAIYRVEKLTHEGSIMSSAQHMARTRPTPNADPARADRNQVLIGGIDPAADVRALLPKSGQRGQDGHLLRRSGSVLALEVLLTASPEWWATSSGEQRRAWLETSVAWLVEEYGRERIAHLRLHQDEATPHLTGFVVPLDPETGRLNARRWTGGRARLAAQQTVYARAVEHLGLKRGVRGSPAHHERVQRHHAAMAQPIAEIPDVETPPRILLHPAAWAAEQTAKTRKAAAPAAARAAEADVARTRAKAAQAGQKAAQGRAERAEAALEAQKALAAQMRSLPLPEVLAALGFEQDREDPDRWRRDEQRIGLGKGAKAGKWFDFVADTGRGGAIDLVAHVQGVDFKGALAWLASAFGPGAAAADLTAQMRHQAVAQVREAVTERHPFEPPEPAPEHWPGVRRWLTEARALPAVVVDRLHERGDVYADARRNAVFLARDPSGAIVGAELKGTQARPDGSRWSGMAPGSLKERGGFRVGVSLARAATVYLVESAVDAISLFALRHEAGERGFTVTSASGVAPKGRPWLERLGEAVRRVCAFDADTAGDRAAEALAWERVRPRWKDWNEELAATRQDRGGGADLAPRAGEEPSPEP